MRKEAALRVALAAGVILLASCARPPTVKLGEPQLASSGQAGEPCRLPQPPEFRTTSSAAETLGRRTEGTWTREEKQRMALAMTSKDPENTAAIVFAGDMLLRSLYCKNSLSSIDSMFVDAPLNIVNITGFSIEALGSARDNYGIDYYSELKSGFSAIRVELEGRKIQVALHPQKAGGETLRFSSADKIRLNGVFIEQEGLSEHSNFYLKFMLARQIGALEVISELSRYAVDLDFEQSFIKPRDESTLNATRIYYIFNRGLPPLFELPSIRFFQLLQVIASLRMIPTYLFGKERGLFTQQDLAALKLYERFTNVLIDQGRIVKNNQGVYEWRLPKDQIEYYRTLVALARLLS